MRVTGQADGAGRRRPPWSLAALLVLPGAAALTAGCGAATSQSSGGPQHDCVGAGRASSASGAGRRRSPAASPWRPSVRLAVRRAPTPEPPLDRPTKKHPLRVYFGGDSLSGMPGMWLGILRQKDGLAKVKADYVESSRLTYGEPVDWPAHLKQQMSTGHYDVGIFMIGANDSGMPMVAGGKSVMYPKKKPGSTSTSSRAKQIATIMLRAGVKRVYWVGMPVMPSSTRVEEDARPQRALRGRRRQQPGRRVRRQLRPALHQERRLQGLAAQRRRGALHRTTGAKTVAKAVWKAIKKDWGGKLGLSGGVPHRTTAQRVYVFGLPSG